MQASTIGLRASVHHRAASPDESIRWVLSFKNSRRGAQKQCAIYRTPRRVEPGRDLESMTWRPITNGSAKMCAGA